MKKIKDMTSVELLEYIFQIKFTPFQKFMINDWKITKLEMIK